MASEPNQAAANDALERIEGALREMTVAMATKTDLQTNTTAIQETLRAEVAGLRADLATQAGRITALEEADAALTARVASTDNAVARQGEMLLNMRRHLEDVDNRGRRCNIRVRGVPEAEGAEDAQNTLKELFRSIMLPTLLPHIEFDRAHRALRPRNAGDGPRDLICCLSSFPVKNDIMTKARERPSWPFRGAQMVPNWILGSLGPPPRPRREPRQRAADDPAASHPGRHGRPTSPEE
ncbi:Hypothetical predicted protein [Pelobates cultripes]|uniref:Uncharacterized protein n=1 Tax=Pelobates cultripes TaxID=61616 RepID=A0AAD1S4H9_PELCU|nr:Hypothetical predicted protein [Pelobates cultripes]